MREIKFRIIVKCRRMKDDYHYDIFYKKMFVSLDNLARHSIKEIIKGLLKENEYYESVESTDQYVGLTDIHGNEMYDKDTILLGVYPSNKRFKFKVEHDQYRWVCKNIDGIINEDFLLNADREYEVIGNIHDDAHLLEDD